MTPLDELNETRRVAIKDGAAGNGAAGAMYRLFQILDPNDVSHWIVAEVGRSGNSERTQTDIHRAFTAFLAQLIAPFCLRYGQHTELAVDHVLRDTYETILEIISRDGKFEIVSVNQDGRQEVFTAFGIATQPPQGRCDPG